MSVICEWVIGDRHASQDRCLSPFHPSRITPHASRITEN